MRILDRVLGRLGYAKPVAGALQAEAEQRAQWLARTLDAAVGAALTARRGLDIAETPEWTHSWSSSRESINDDLESGLGTARNRSRGLAKNNEWARRYQLLARDNIFGPKGITLQMRMTKRDASPNDAVNQAIESAWAKWGKRGNCEVTGRWSWRRIEWLALNHLIVDGAYLIRLKRAAGPFGLLLQVLNPNTLDYELRRDYEGRRVRMGIEIDDDGRPLAYWLKAYKAGEVDSWQGQQIGRHVRVPADEILHDFLPDFADQYDGLPALTVGARRLWLTSQFEEAAAVASTNAARRVGFFQTKDGEAPTSVADTIVSSVLEAAKAQGKVLTPDEINALMASAQKISTTVPGTFDTLPTGTEFLQFKSDFPHVNHADFVKQGVRGFSAGQGVSYHTLGNDLESVNYSSARVGIIDERERYKTLQEAIVEGLHERVFSAWLEMALVRSPLLARLQFDRLQEYLDAATWQPRRWAGIDPVKEATADEINLRLKLTSRRRRILERGEDPDEVFAEIEREEEQFGPIAGSSSTPPAEPDDDEGEQGGPNQPARSEPRVIPLR